MPGSSVEKRVLFKIITSADVAKANEKTLDEYCLDVIGCKVSYEDAAEEIEDKAYEYCVHGNVEYAIKQLNAVAQFFEGLENKNEEHSRDLADIYLLIGQMLQFAGRYDDSITWLSRSVVVDDQYPVPYHNLAVSYEKIGQTDSAIRSLKQELQLAPGNYYSYLILSEIYKGKHRYTEYEACLKQLLERDPDNMQGLFRLIQLYKTRKTSTDISLLYRKVLGVTKNYNATEWMIRIYVLCMLKKYNSAIDTVDEWQKTDPVSSLVNLSKVYIYGFTKQIKFRNAEIDTFVKRNKGCIDKINKKLDEFSAVFGTVSKNRIEKNVVKHTLELFTSLNEQPALPVKNSKENALLSH